MINNRLRTDFKLEQKLQELQNALQLSSKAAIMRISMGYSLKLKSEPFISKNESKLPGADYARVTIFGDDEIIYRIMMETHLGKKLLDQEFFPSLVLLHIERGVDLLYSDYKLMRKKEKIFLNNMRKS